MSKTSSLALRLAAIPILLGLAAAMEAGQFFGFFRLLTFIFVFLLLADVASLAGGKTRDFLLALTSFAFGFCVIEAAAYVLEPKQLIVDASGSSVPRPIIGWGPERAGRFHSQKTDVKTGATIYSVDYTIDANLLRQTFSSPSAPVIAFFGDSMTFGVGVSDAETMPQFFADSLDRKLRVLNLAFIGHGPSQFLRELETGIYDPLLGANARLFVFMTAAWHAERTSCKASWVLHAPRYVLENGAIAFKGPCSDGQSRKLLEWLGNSAAYRFFIAPYRAKARHDDIELYLRILAAAVTLAKEKYNVPTMIPYLHVSENYLKGTGFDNDAIAQRLRDTGAIVLDVSLAKERDEGAKIAIEGDGHPTPLAHRLRALMLKTYIEQHMAGALRPGPE
jgi:hypothetical protein